MTGITKVTRVMAPVTDQDRAIAFYRDVVGMELRADQPFGDGQRWVEVAPPGSEAAIALVPANEHVPAGRMTGIILGTADAGATHAALLAGGVDVDPEVMRMGAPVPPMFWFRDPDANVLMVVEG